MLSVRVLRMIPRIQYEASTPVGLDLLIRHAPNNELSKSHFLQIGANSLPCLSRWSHWAPGRRAAERISIWLGCGAVARLPHVL